MNTTSRILLIINDRSLRTLINHLLRSRGYTVTNTNNTIDGFNCLYDNEPPHLIILDEYCEKEKELSFVEGVKASGLFYKIPILLILEENSKLIIESDGTIKKTF